MRVARFVSTTLFVFSGPLVWAAHFVGIYAFTAIACARRFAEATWLGIGVVQWAIGGATLIAVGVTLATMLAAARQARRGADEVWGFIYWMTIAFGALTLIAVLWEAMPALIVPTCG